MNTLVVLTVLRCLVGARYQQNAYCKTFIIYVLHNKCIVKSRYVHSLIVYVHSSTQLSRSSIPQQILPSTYTSESVYPGIILLALTGVRRCSK
jgi:hypothetical protein